MAMIVATIVGNASSAVGRPAYWSAQNDCIVNISGTLNNGGSLSVGGIVYISSSPNQSVSFNITGELIKIGEGVTITTGQARIAGFTV